MTEFDLDLISRCLTGRATAEERARFEQWLAASPDNWLLVQAVREVAADGDASASAEWKAAAAAALREAMAVSGPSAEPKTRPLQVMRGVRRPVRVSLAGTSHRSAFARVAAVAALVAGVIFGGQWLLGARRDASPDSVQIAERTISAAWGQRIAFRLRDGTEVTLAPGSTLRTAVGYGVRDRVVQLDGEAAFTVTHDTARPFEVRTARTVARDLGTRFIIRSYADETSHEVVVAEGRVAVRRVAAPASDGLVLQSGDRAAVTSAGPMALTRGVALDPYFAWTEGRLLFRAAPLRDAIIQLSRWYDVDIQLASPDIGALRLHASFQHETADEAIRVLAAILRLHVTNVGRTYTLRAQ